MFEGFLTSVLAQAVFVFILIFALIFGILQKSRIFGEEAKQVNALVSLAIALLVLSAGYALDLISKLVPILAIGSVLILIFLIFISFFFEKDYKPSEWLRNTAIGIAFVAVVVTIMVLTGAFTIISGWFTSGSNWASNLSFIIIIVIVFSIVFFTTKSGSDKK